MPTTATATERSYLDLISDCVHCGFCLPACPTYRSWANEMDSPRGRIDLMKGVAENAIPLTPTVVEHFDRCLGCMGCVTACPSGVRYDLLIEATRATVEERTHRSPFDRAFRALIFWLFPYPKRLAAFAPWLALYARSGLQSLVRRSGLLRLLPARLQQLEELTPPASAPATPLPERTAARGSTRARVGLVAGCVQRVFFPNVNAATIRVLAAEGCEVLVPPKQGCCGALSLHAGRYAEALRFARALVDAFDTADLDFIAINAAGCGSALKQYGTLLAGDPAYAQRALRFAAKVRDVHELLAALEPRAPRAAIPVRVAYHDACHLAHAQKIREQPRALLRSIPLLELLEIPSGEECCGSAGVYNLLEPEAAREIGDRKVKALVTTGAELLASANPGCTLQIRSRLRARGLNIDAAHPIEILDRSIERAASGL